VALHARPLGDRAQRRTGRSERSVQLDCRLGDPSSRLGHLGRKIVGFFSEAEIVSSFDEPIQPIGLATVTQAASAPVPA
jgi:hypothetical protein